MHTKKETWSFLCASLFALTASLPAVAQSTANWKTFSPKTHEFSVLMPSPVTEATTDDQGTMIGTYKGEDNGNFVVSVASVGDANDVDGTIDTAILSLKENGVHTPAGPHFAGKGWRGRLFHYAKPNEPQKAILATAVDGTDVMCFLTSNQPADDPAVKAFLDSFVAYPKDVSSAHKNDSRPFSVITPLIVLFAIIMGIIRFARRKKSVNVSGGSADTTDIMYGGRKK